MQDLIKRYHEANEKYCGKCARRVYCIEPCPLMYSYVHNMTCTAALERLAGLGEVKQNANTDRNS